VSQKTLTLFFYFYYLSLLQAVLDPSIEGSARRLKPTGRHCCHAPRWKLEKLKIGGISHKGSPSPLGTTILHVHQVELQVLHVVRDDVDT